MLMATPVDTPAPRAASLSARSARRRIRALFSRRCAARHERGYDVLQSVIHSNTRRRRSYDAELRQQLKSAPRLRHHAAATLIRYVAAAMRHMRYCCLFTRLLLCWRDVICGLFAAADAAMLRAFDEPISHYFHACRYA